MNYLPQDLLSHILNIRSEEMKKDKQIKDNKIKFNEVLDEIDNSFFFMLSGVYYYNSKNVEGITDLRGYPINRHINPILF